MRTFPRTMRLLLLFLVLTLGGCALGRQLGLAGSPAARLAADVTIERDGWGTPTVHGSTDAAAIFGLAYAMAEDAYGQIEEDYIHQLGWAAHYYGERYLADDLVRRALGGEAAGRAAFAAEPVERQELWTAFAEGLNYYLATHPATARKLIARYEPWMILARALAIPGAAEQADGIALAAIATTLGVPNAGMAPAAVPTATRAVLVAGDSGEARLVGVIEGPFFGTGQLYEAGVTTADGWSFRGVAVLGLPWFRAGHNAAVAWLAAEDTAAVTVTRLLLTDSLHYRHDGAQHALTPVIDTLMINTSEGVRAHEYRFLHSASGTVFARRGDTAFVVRIAPGTLAESWARMKATSLPSFRAALARVPGAAYADTAGAVARLGALTPLEVPGAATDADAELVRAAWRANDGDAASEIAALIDEWERIGGTNPERAFRVDTLVERLRAWQHVGTDTSAAAVLYRWWQTEYGSGEYATGFGRFRALEAAAARMTRELGGTDVAAGDVYRLQRLRPFRDGQPSVPLPHARHAERGADGRRYAVGGIAWLGLFELTSPPRLRSIVPFGSSADSASAHFFDQAPAYARGELKDAAEVRERYRPGARARRVQGETTGRQRP